MWSAMMALNSNGKHVERSRELVRGQQERRGQPDIVPPGQAHRAGAEVVGRKRIDHRQDMEGRCFAAVSTASVTVAGVALFGLSSMDAVYDDRSDAGAEHLAQVAVERSRRRWDLGHMSIM